MEPINKTSPADNKSGMPSPEVGASKVQPVAATPAPPSNPAPPASEPKGPDVPMAAPNKVD